MKIRRGEGDEGLILQLVGRGDSGVLHLRHPSGDLRPGQCRAGFKKSAKSDITRSIRNRLRANRVDTITRYETKSGSTKTRKTWKTQSSS